MSIICGCESGFGNTGLPACYKAAGVPKGVFIVQQFDSLGVKNVILSSDTVDDAYILAKINNVDASKRWYPLQDIKNVTGDRADPVYDSAPDGSQAFVKEGVRTLSFEAWKGGRRLKKAIDQGRCGEFGFFTIEEGRINGMDLTDQGLQLAPIRIAPYFLVAKSLDATDTTVEKVSITLQYDQREDDSNLSYINADEDADLTGYRGLLDIFSTITESHATSVKVQLSSKFAGINSKDLLTGLVLGDFTLYNVTTSTAVVITSIVEDPAGTYKLNFAAQTVTNVLRLTIVKQGYDFTAVTAKTITVAA